MAKRLPPPCRVKGCPEVWRCRNCGRRTCEHRCGYKTEDKTAMCMRCQQIIAAGWGKP